MEEILKLINVTYSYNTPLSEVTALKNVNFTVYKGEFIAIIGPSGCGKTTLLSIIDGLIKANSGQVLFFNKELQKTNPNIGYMLQRDELFPWRTVEKNVFLPMEIQKTVTKENKQRALNLLDKYGLKEFKKSYPKELSGGMRQRVSLIRTLSLNPELLLLDEPFSALDYQTRLSVCEDVYNVLRKEEKTAILVTHDIAEALSFADRILVLTKRPAKIKTEHTFNFSKNLTPNERRKRPDFFKYFDVLWGELNDEK